MHRGFDESPLGLSMLFSQGLAMKEYFDTFPKDARKKVSAHRFELSSVEEEENHSEEDFKKS